MERAAQDRYPLIRCTNGYIRFIRSENKLSSKQASAGLVAAARTKEIEQRVAIRQNQLIALAEHDAIFVEAFGVVKSCFARLPACVDLDLRGKVAAEIDAIFADAEAGLPEGGSGNKGRGSHRPRTGRLIAIGRG